MWFSLRALSQFHTKLRVKTKRGSPCLSLRRRLVDTHIDGQQAAMRLVAQLNAFSVSSTSSSKIRSPRVVLCIAPQLAPVVVSLLALRRATRDMRALGPAQIAALPPPLAVTVLAAGPSSSTSTFASSSSSPSKRDSLLTVALSPRALSCESRIYIYFYNYVLLNATTFVRFSETTSGETSPRGHANTLSSSTSSMSPSTSLSTSIDTNALSQSASAISTPSSSASTSPRGRAHTAAAVAQRGIAYFRSRCDVHNTSNIA